MRPLRQSMIDAMVVRGFSPSTRDCYVKAICATAKHYRRDPAEYTAQEVDAYLLHMVQERLESNSKSKFIFADAMYGEVQEEMEPGVEDESRVSLIKAMAGSNSFTWVYDYGDYWEHKVKVERIVDLGVPLDMVMCMTGKNACPPEDVGGAPGYAEFLNAIRDPENPEHQNMLQWCGGAFDPSAFDPFDAQQRLNEIKL